jgi:hypothetical protein
MAKLHKIESKFLTLSSLWLCLSIIYQTQEQYSRMLQIKREKQKIELLEKRKLRKRQWSSRLRKSQDKLKEKRSSRLCNKLEWTEEMMLALKMNQVNHNPKRVRRLQLQDKKVTPKLIVKWMEICLNRWTLKIMMIMMKSQKTQMKLLSFLVKMKWKKTWSKPLKRSLENKTLLEERMKIYKSKL